MITRNRNATERLVWADDSTMTVIDATAADLLAAGFAPSRSGGSAQEPVLYTTSFDLERLARLRSVAMNVTAYREEPSGHVVGLFAATAPAQEPVKPIGYINDVAFDALHRMHLPGADHVTLGVRPDGRDPCQHPIYLAPQPSRVAELERELTSAQRVCDEQRERAKANERNCKAAELELQGTQDDLAAANAALTSGSTHIAKLTQDLVAAQCRAAACERFVAAFDAREASDKVYDRELSEALKAARAALTPATEPRDRDSPCDECQHAVGRDDDGDLPVVCERCNRVGVGEDDNFTPITPATYGNAPSVCVVCHQPINPQQAATGNRHAGCEIDKADPLGMTAPPAGIDVMVWEQRSCKTCVHAGRTIRRCHDAGCTIACKEKWVPMPSEHPAPAAPVRVTCGEIYGNEQQCTLPPLHTGSHDGDGRDLAPAAKPAAEPKRTCGTCHWLAPDRCICGNGRSRLHMQSRPGNADPCDHWQAKADKLAPSDPPVETPSGHVGPQNGPQSTDELCPGCEYWRGTFCCADNVKFIGNNGLHCNKRKPLPAPAAKPAAEPKRTCETCKHYDAAKSECHQSCNPAMGSPGWVLKPAPRSRVGYIYRDFFDRPDNVGWTVMHAEHTDYVRVRVTEEPGGGT